MLDRNLSYLGNFRVMKVNPRTWADLEKIPMTSNYSIKANMTDDVPLLQAGTFEVNLEDGQEFEPGWYRIEMSADDGYEMNDRVYLATLLCETTSGGINYGREKVKIQGRSPLAPVNDAKMLAGEFINKGADGAQWVYEMVKSHTPAPVTVVGSFTVDAYYVWDANTSYLKAVWQILDAAGWCMMLNGLGEITICAKPTEPVLSYERITKSLFVPGMDYDKDYTSIPNRYYAIEGSNIAVATNEDETSIVSFNRRGWWKDEIDTDVIRVNGENLQQYAERMLEAKSVVTVPWSYSRAYVEGVVPFAMIRANDADTVQGDLRIMSQSINTEHGLIVDEEAGLEVALWKRPILS